MLATAEKISPPAQESFVCRRRRDPAFEFRWHFHPEVELTLIVRSRGRRFVGDHIADYRDGDLVLLGPNLPHTWCSEPERARPKRPHEAIVVQFSEAFLGREFLARPEMVHVRRLLERSARGIRFAGRTQRTVAKRMARMPALRGLARVTKLLEILETLARSREGEPLSSREFVPSLRRADLQRIDRVCRFINENYTEEMTLPEAASIAHMSAPAFCRFFKKKTGKTFVGYVTELRVGFACRRLIETDRTVLQICMDSGFNNLSNFNRQFRKLKQTSPREYRRHFLPRSPR